jgi:WD40 repeat protein
MNLEKKRLVKCCLTDGSILQDYTSMLWDAERPTGIPAEVWDDIGPSSPGENKFYDIAATSDHKWLFALCNKGWWAMFDIQQDKCVSRKYCRPCQIGFIPVATSIAVSPNDQLLYMVTTRGSVESYDIQAAKTRKVKFFESCALIKITVDPNNKFVFIASISGDLFKFDSGLRN